ncbi:hypothetical protein FisN_3Hh374 [Fistulifera solaris]|uniref:CCT domain-containing protein n=1 Tax=Fistulifera solaris TaxID=1519565 RepID=A0A1Z5JQ38_FISSO|nr:hypothetical protein FisN_3Hh374 [Fistulifera solaris]|eukprot:GAX16145.1 hypothetical protein FisN_3Hh374 [Fistulifera solaris]
MSARNAKQISEDEGGGNIDVEGGAQSVDIDFLLDSNHSEDAGDGDALVRGNEEDKRDVAVHMESTSFASMKGKPIRIPQEAIPQQSHPFQPQSLPSSQGSSGSAFLSSMLNPQLPLSHTPPNMASSYEVSHFGKRARAGSVSGRLRSASEYLERKGLLDRNTKGILQDLIIIGDEELQSAIDFYEAGDPSKLEEMIQSGALQNRLPNDIDLLGDLDFDFLTMSDGIGADMTSNIDTTRSSPTLSTVANIAFPASEESGGIQQDTARKSNMGMVTPSYDGIGDLEFAGDLMSDQSDFMQFQEYDSKHASVANSPGEASNMSEYEQRIRSNSLFSALLNDPKTSSNNTSQPTSQDNQYGKWMDRRNFISKKPVVPQQDEATSSGIGASLLEAERKRIEKEAKKEQKEKAKLERKEKKGREKKETEEAEKVEHVPGSGRPRSFSDPNIRTSYDADGLQQVERPEGWVGAYSPDSRRVRIDRFMQKRNHRVWAKTVKYDVRKNFANSRLRVKGRFVKKEDEVLMRELMSLT